MQDDKISEAEIRFLVSAKKLQPSGMGVFDYPDEFIQGALIDRWASFKGAVERMRVRDDELPF